MNTNQLNIRLTNRHMAMVNELATEYGSISSAMRVAIEKLHQEIEQTKRGDEMKNEIVVRLNRPDLDEFLNDDSNYTERYRAEMERRLNRYAKATVTITESGRDTVTGYGDTEWETRGAQDTFEFVANEMVSDWDWLKE